MKISTLCLLIISFSGQAKFLHSDVTIKDYSQIIKLAQENEYYKSQRTSLVSRTAGIYFSMREEYLTNFLLSKKSYWCLDEESVDIEAIFNQINQGLAKNSDDIYPEMSFTKAVRNIIIKNNQCNINT